VLRGNKFLTVKYFVKQGANKNWPFKVDIKRKWDKNGIPNFKNVSRVRERSHTQRLFAYMINISPSLCTECNSWVLEVKTVYLLH